MSYQVGDEIIEGVISNCCGAPINQDKLCSFCSEHCGTEPDSYELELERDRDYQEANMPRYEY